MANADASDTSRNTFSNEAESSSNDKSTAVVFQCAQCNSVVGDSTSWITADKVMRTITLSFVTSKVGVKPMIEISKNGVDKDSTYHVLYCICCNEVLGKQYLASSPQLDPIRGKFTVMVEKLNSYEIGSAEKGGQSNLADMLSVPTAGYLEQEVGKIRYLIMSLNHRMKTIETHLHLEINSLTTVSDNHQNGTPNGQNGVKNSEESDSVSSSENVMDTSCLKDQQMFCNFVSKSQDKNAGKSHNNLQESGKVLYRNVEGDQCSRDVIYKSSSNRRRGSKYVQAMGEPAINKMRGTGQVTSGVEQRSRTLRGVPDDATDVSEIVTEIESDHNSLMEEWPSPSSQKRRSVKRRKFDDD